VCLRALDAETHHVPKTGVGLVLTGVGERGGDLGSAFTDLSERVDRGGAHVGVRVMEELERTRHEQVVGRATVALLARIARKRVECARADGGILVVERGDEVGDGLLVEELVEECGADAPDDGLPVTETAAERRYRGGPGRQQMALRLLPAVRDRELRDPAVEVVAAWYRTHSATVRSSRV
jgi:hypothetical protein